MPVGRVRFFNTERGFGFIQSEDGDEIFLPASALPAGVSSVRTGTRVDYGVVQGHKGAQALSVRIIQGQPRPGRKDPDAMAVITEDLLKVLDKAGNNFKRGRYPSDSQCKLLASMLRRLADGLDV